MIKFIIEYFGLGSIFFVLSYNYMIQNNMIDVHSIQNVVKVLTLWPYYGYKIVINNINNIKK